MNKKKGLSSENKEKIISQLTRIRRRINVAELNENKYQNCLVSFFDLLGFTQLINDWSSGAIFETLRIFSATNSDHSLEQGRVKTFQFSDSIIRKCHVHPHPDDEIGMYSPLISEINSIALIQFEMACWYGIFMRGGLTFGEIYSDSDMAFGPAIVEAYILESKNAIYPRILVQNRLIESLDEFRSLSVPGNKAMLNLVDSGNIEDAGLEFTKMLLEECLLKDNNNDIFLDYLGMNIKGADLTFLSSHKNSIINEYNQTNKNTVREKYVWLKEYHNFCVLEHPSCREIGVNDSNKNQFLISDNDIPQKCSNYKIERFYFELT